jgi:hypothetical protein
VADFDVDVRIARDTDAVLNGRWFPQVRHLAVRVPAVHYLSLLAGELTDVMTSAGGTRIRFLHGPHPRSSRISPETSPIETMRETLRRIVLEHPPGLPPAPEELTVVEAPLRLDLTTPAEGAVVVSDRALRVHWLLRPFHELQLAQALYAEWLRPYLAAREPGGDYPWVSEGLARVFAARFVAQARPGTRSVQEWIELFNVFAIVDRFESAPKIPFVGSFFERTPAADPLHERITTFNNDRPPGHVIMSKLRQLLGDQTFAEVVDACTTGPEPFRACAARASRQDLTWFFDQWLQPFPRINYALGPTRLNERASEHYRTDVTVQREASRRLREPVDIELRSIGGHAVRVRWDADGEEGRLSVNTPQRVHQVVIDPDRRLIETTRADNAWPPSPQVVVDTAEVEITSTEFGVSGVMVGRGRYDYRKDLALTGFYTNRSVGVAVGPRYHWGTPNDPTLYRHNLYGFYSAQALDRSFNDERRPSLRTAGHTNALGVRYDYNDIYAYDNPTESVHVRLFADWHDAALGSDFTFVDWGGSVVLTHPLWTHRTIAAGEVFNGFSEPLGSSRVPNQVLYSLGGSRSIRGIGAEDELGRNIFLLRGEIRQAVYPEVDLNFMDFLVLRRLQGRLFVDTGQVGDAAGRVYDPAGYAVGVGVGFGAVYEFMGFFPSVAYVELATRVDRGRDAGDVQFLFGTRQAF